MTSYVFAKSVFALVVMLGAATCSFLLLRAMPGDPAEALAGPQATQEDIQHLRESLGLDRPVASGRQALTMIKDTLTTGFLRSGRPIG